MMRISLLRALGFIWALAVIVPAASAHSVKDLEATLGDREKYFQPIDKEAPAFTLQDADGRIFRIADFRGKVVVLHFIYANCPDICPLHSERIAEIQSLVNQTPMKDVVQFITVTTDPANDTADVLRAYGSAHGLESVNWLFLTAPAGQPEDTTRKLAEQFGHRFDKADDGYQAHGIVTHVIDKEGHWRANFHGLKFDPTNLVIFANALVNDFGKPHGHHTPSLWEKLKSFLW